MRHSLLALCIALPLSACQDTTGQGPPPTPPPSSQTSEATPNTFPKISDDNLCNLALSSDFASKHGNPHWEDHSGFRKYVDEAKRRGFSAHGCADLLGWQIVKSPNSPKTTFQEETPSTRSTTMSLAQDAREEIYSQIMDLVSRDTIEQAIGRIHDKGQKLAYRSYRKNKTLAVCIDWNRSGTNIVYEGWWANEGDKLKSESKRRALQNCRDIHEIAGCKCQVVDQNDENVLQVPHEFLAHYNRTAPSNAQIEGASPNEGNIEDG